jgi:LysR family transcriptional activator of mexEF-oprN operon
MADDRGGRGAVRAPGPRSVSTFANLGGLLDGSALLVMVPELVARHIRRVRPHLRIRPPPFALRGGATELLWPSTLDDDGACRFVRDRIREIARTGSRGVSRGRNAPGR